ncbi:hypothetical protein GCM10011351_09170 [Paraliobacillus quinghaiensis]|uniref:IDEAL domain-containing protein n=1 Tax=Paraliobacillus quinghaiensis TaxID=470815 RepID=A0A917TJW8_9BACI|nr:IDEAL domain-containing protein [Paraliobacillus quinghaiensis]GGM25631.1 hypothetical protein GCM10011351_09170 [Paraliobacillus quinghaiensis]
MKKHKVNYTLKAFDGRKNASIEAKREISFEIKLASRLILDALVSDWNKSNLEKQINDSIDKQDKERFLQLSKQYQTYTLEY